MNNTKDNTTIYHNPRCSKSRQTMQLLQDNGIEAKSIDYLKNPPNHTTLKHILGMLGLKPRELMRHKETLYRELGLDSMELSDEALIDAMVKHPILIERPIVIRNNQAALGRPPEKILEILSS